MTAVAETGRRPLFRSPAAVVGAIFFLQSMSFGGWFARIGDIQLGIGLTPDALGLALMGQLVGALLTYPVGPPAVERFGTRPLLLVAIPVTALGCALSALAGGAGTLFLALVLNGIGHGFATIATNVEADRVEALTGRRVFGTAHGVWSLGFVAATALGVLARAGGVAPFWHLAGMVAVVTAGVLLVALPMRPAPPRSHVPSPARRRFALPRKPILLLILFIQASSFLENGSFQWSIIYFRDQFEAPVWLETMTLPIFLLSTAIGRLLTDGWVERYGPARVASALAVLCVVGLVPVAWAGSLWLSLLGFVLIGFGVSCAFPLSVSAAARIGDRPASANVATFSVIQRTLAMLVPVLIGLIAARWGVAAAFGAMLPLPILSILLARCLEPAPVPPGRVG